MKAKAFNTVASEVEQLMEFVAEQLECEDNNIQIYGDIAANWLGITIAQKESWSAKSVDAYLDKFCAHVRAVINMNLNSS